MTLPAFVGIIPILMTPFDDQERVDHESLRRLVEFNLAAGVKGLGIALGSEVYKLTAAERDAVVATTVDQAAGRAPVIVNISAPATKLAVLGAQQAVALGAAGLMSTPPFAGASVAELVSYFGAISDAASVPMMVQDTATLPVPAPVLRTLADRVEHVRYAKVESVPQPHQVRRAVTAAAGTFAVLGGASGLSFLEELRRGAVGTMPWPSTPAPFVAVWAAWQSGNPALARQIFERELAPLLRISLGTISDYHHLHKAVLRRQGIIASVTVRGPADPLDPATLADLDEALALIGLATPETGPARTTPV